MMSPVGFHVNFFGIRLGTIWDLGGQFIYLALRAIVFGISAFFVNSIEKQIYPSMDSPQRFD